jgi:hypothetical protein
MFVSFLHLVVDHFEIGTKKGVNLSDSGKHKFGKFQVLSMPFFGDQQV